MSLFERVHRRGATVLIATHDLDRVRRLGYREIRLKAGQLVDTKASPILHPPEVRA
jgi:ABC-type ATPase involved in cell division